MRSRSCRIIVFALTISLFSPLEALSGLAASQNPAAKRDSDSRIRLKQSVVLSAQGVAPDAVKVTLLRVGENDKEIALPLSGESEYRLQSGIKIKFQVESPSQKNLYVTAIYLEYEKSKSFYLEALAIAREVRNRVSEGAILHNLGSIRDALGEPEKALEYYAQSLPIRREVKDKAGEAYTLNNMMFAAKNLGRKPLAILYGKQSVNAYQEVRNNLIALGRDSRQGFIGTKASTYRELADLLITEGRLPEAEQVLGLLKEEEYFDFVRRDPAASALLKRSDLTPEEKAAIERYNDMSARVIEAGNNFSRLSAMPARSKSEEEQFEAAARALEDANRTFQVFLRQLAEDFKEGGRIARDINEDAGLIADLKQLGKGVVALYTITGKENYRVILTTPTLQIAREADPKTSAEELDRLVLEFRQAVQNPTLNPQPLAERLFKIIIGPVENDLKATGAKTILWSLDGVLRYLPIAALHDGSRYLAERYQNVVITLASRTRLPLAPRKNWRALAMGVSKPVEKEWGKFNALPGVPEELRGIVKVSTAGGVLPGQLMLDEKFTRSAMERGLAQRTSNGNPHFQVVHIASHFSFKPGNETESFLLLGNGERLTLDKIRVSQSQRFDGVELLTLSACDTATGGGGATGQEVEGFAVLAQQKGAQAVMATLWPVADESTKELMKEFYRLRESNAGMAKAEALRLAQTRFAKGIYKALTRKERGAGRSWRAQ